MIYSGYFTPLSSEIEFNEGTIGSSIIQYTENNFPELNSNGIALIYVPEFRNGEAQFQGKSNDNFRHYFYNLFLGSGWDLKLYDLGTILPGNEIEDTYFALRSVVSSLIKNF